MTKKSKNPFKVLADCVGTAIVSIAIVPALLIDVAFTAISD